MRRKDRSSSGRPIARAPQPAKDRSRLPTAAALLAALATLAITPTARAVVPTASDAGTEVADSDSGADAEGDAGDAGAKPVIGPDPGEYRTGGVPPPTRVRGSGCGCGSEGAEHGNAAALTSAAAFALGSVLRRRRSPR